TEAETMTVAESLYAELKSAGVDVLLDDRDQRPGVKFKDADLIGIPLRVNVGGKGLKEGVVELKWREAKEAAKVPLADAVSAIRERLATRRAEEAARVPA
ncbi:MAG: proline--tRNA ligase, partial [Candidatus Saccharimonas sp.]|nr:proline--tRNA ligase [Planctomycetaceae bacterium]